MTTADPSESLPQRVARLESEMGDLKPSLRQRLEKLEARPEKAAPAAAAAASGGRWWGLVEKALLPLFSSAVVLLLGYWTKDSVDQAVRQKQLDLSYAKEMQSLLATLADPAQPRADLDSAALTLSLFGEAAVVPLLNNLLPEPGSLRALAARNGLRALAFSHQAPVCAALERVLHTRARIYRWPAYLDVVELTGELECTSAAGELRRFAASLGEGAEPRFLDALAARARPDPAPTFDALEQLRQAARTALATLETAEAAGRGRGSG